MGTKNRSFSCHYAGKADGPRYETWREEFGRRWVAIDFLPLAGNCIVSEISCTEHSFLALCSMRGTPVRMDLRNDLAQDERGYRFLILASGARLQACQHGRSIDLPMGQMTLM